MEVSGGPRVVTSRRSIRYRASAWRVHEFEVRGADGALVCRVSALRLPASLLLWLGAEPPRLCAAALGLPGGGAGGVGGGAGGAALLGGEETAAARLARRLAVALRRPVHVCSGAAFDRFTLPLVERALVQEIKSRPECF